MNILIAPDSFKDSLSAKKVAEALKTGFLKGFPEAQIQILPMADGGEGTVESVIDATDGEMVKLEVMDPLMRPTDSFYGISGDGNSAVIEMAAASGLEKLKPSERNPWITSTYGTGQLIENALERGCRKILIGIGGSATNDCGAGMAEALGVKFTDQSGAWIGKGGGELDRVKKIDITGLLQRISSAEIVVACDVANPLCGPGGASFVYGPQKGADPEMVKKLDRNLEYFAGLIKEQLGKDISSIPGSGAAGGLGAGMLTFLNAKLMRGFDMIAEMVNLEEKIIEADLVITGEGKIDSQTQFGKTPFGVAMLASKHSKPVIAVAGAVGSGTEVLYNYGINAIFPITDRPVTLEESIQGSQELLERTGERVARMLKIAFTF